MSKTYLLRFQGVIIFIFSFIASEVHAQKAEVRAINFTELARLTKSQPEHRNREKEIDGGWRALRDMPMPPTAKIKKQNITITPFTPNSIESLSPPPLQDFLGYIDPSQSIPPDTHGAVGINNVVTATNDFIIVHAKNGGAVLSQMTLAAFFDNAGISDPYMQYDPYLNRYWISAISTENTNKVYIGVSKSGDPLQGWYIQSFTPVSNDGALLLDHPYLGFDNRLLVVSGRKFPGASSFTGTVLFCFNKAPLAAGLPISFGINAQTIEKTPTDGDAPCPVTVYGLSAVPASTFYILQNWNGSASAIRLSTVTGSIPNLTWNTSSAEFPVGGTPWADGNLGNLAAQISETRKIAVNDSRISSAVMINGQIWCAHHIGLPADNYTHTAVQWWELSTSGTILQRGRIDDPAGLVSRYYPAIAVNSAEDVLIGYTISSPATRVNAAYSSRTAATPANATDDEYVYKGGLSSYWKDFNSGRARWGDYSHSVLDPLTGNLWTVQQYAEQRIGPSDNQSRFGVWWAEVSFTKYDNDIALSAIIDPNNAAPYCDLPVAPRVTVNNVGLDTVKSLSIGLILDGLSVGSQTFNNLSLGHFDYQNLFINLPLSPAAGTHLLKVYTFNPNAVKDERTSNDTATISFTVLQTMALPNVEGFESTTFPPAGGWNLTNPDAGITWARTTQASKSGAGSITLNGFSYTNIKQEDILSSPRIDLNGVDSIKVNFDVAYSQYSANAKDSLQIVYSTDCGVTWKQTGYRKGGASLSTTGKFVTTSFVPMATEWRNESIDISTCGLTASSMVLGLRSVNYHGNNIYVDNFAVSKVDTKRFNASVISINKPITTLCGNDLTPEITIANNGADTLNSLKLNYQIDNGPIGTFNFAGTIARCSTQVITLNPISSIPGTHVLTIFSTEPNGAADEYSFNDTVRKSLIISPVLDAPAAEGFESTTFPPANWNVINEDKSITWERSTAAAKTGLASMVIRNFDYPVENTIDKFVSPVVKFDPKVDSFFVSFDYAYALGLKFPGSSGLPADTLEVQITQDCGQTFTTIWKKWGADLETISPAASNGASFIPTSIAQWKSVNVYLSPIIGTTDFQAYFVAKSNKQNNLYLDNINIYTKTLPQLLKDQGYLIYPSPFKNTFLIRNYRVPTTLQKVSIYNSVGQLVWAKNLNGKGYTEMTVDLSNLARGMYIVKLSYTEKTVVERIVKQ